VRRRHRAIGLVDRFAACFHDARRQHLIEHSIATLVGQRVFAIALGYEDLNDHDELRHDPMMAVLAGKLEAKRETCAPVAGKSTLNRLELSRLQPTRYHKISHNPIAIKRLFVDHDPAFAAPGAACPILELPEVSRRPAAPAPALRLGPSELTFDLSDQPLVLLQPEHEIDAVRLAPGHQLVAGKATVGAQYNAHVRPASGCLSNRRRSLGHNNFRRFAAPMRLSV
jgi:hypothetical protein